MPADERQERERVREPLLDRAQLRDEHEHAPEAVDDRRDGGQQVREDRERRAQRPRAELGDVERRRDGDCDADDERHGGSDQRADDQRQRAEDRARDVPVVVEREAEEAELREREVRLRVEPDEEERDEREDARREQGQSVLQQLVRQARGTRPPGECRAADANAACRAAHREVSPRSGSRCR